MYALFSFAWIVLALACTIIMPADTFLIPALICAGMSLYSTARASGA